MPLYFELVLFHLLRLLVLFGILRLPRFGIERGHFEFQWTQTHIHLNILLMLIPILCLLFLFLMMAFLVLVGGGRRVGRRVGRMVGRLRRLCSEVAWVTLHIKISA